MANVYTQNEDGTYQMVHPSTGVLIGDAMNVEQLVEMKTYESKNLSPRTEAGSKRSVAKRNRQKLSDIRDNMDLTEKMQNPEYAKEYTKYSTGYGMEGPDIPGFFKTTGMHMLEGLESIGLSIAETINDIEGSIYPEDIPNHPTQADREVTRSSINAKQQRLIDNEGDVLHDATDISQIGHDVPLLVAASSLEIPAGLATMSGLSKVGSSIRGGASKIPLDKEGIVGSLRDISLQSINKGKVVDPYKGQRTAEYIGTSETGAVEGALMDDRTWEEGMAENLVGTTIGRKASMIGRRTENMRDDAQKKIMLDSQRLGKIYMPGVRLGDEQKQVTESIMRGNPNIMNKMAQYDKANASVDNRVVSEALGIGNPDGLPMVNFIDDNLKFTKDRFDELSNITNGKFSQTGLNRLDTHRKNLKLDANPDDLPSIAQLDSYMNMFSRWQRNAGLPPRARVGEKTFDGPEYQRTRTSLSNRISAARKSGDLQLKETLEMIRDELDNGVRHTIGNANQSGNRNAILKGWEDAREDFALNSMIKDEALNVDGSLNMQKLHEYFLKNNKDRYLLPDADDRLKDVFAVSKSDEIWRNRKSAGLGGTNIDQFENRDSISLLDRSMNRMMSPLQEAQLGYYRMGGPDIGFGPGLSEGMGRAGGVGMQAGAPHIEAGKKLNDIASYVNDLLIEWDMKDEEEEPTQDPNGATQ